jgi:hypothetical protein
VLRSALAAVAGLLLAGCGGGAAACPATGGPSTLTVRFDGDGAAVARVQLCVDAGCAPVAYGTANAPAGLGVVRAQRQDLVTWVFTLDETPPRLVVRPFGRGDAALAESAVAPAWQRLGGSERCGGPHVAEVTARV